MKLKLAWALYRIVGRRWSARLWWRVYKEKCYGVWVQTL